MDDFKTELKDFISGRLPNMPPSERGPYEAILGQLRVNRPDNNRMYFVTANLSKPKEARRLEALLARDGIKGVSQQSANWSPKGHLVVYMALETTPALYTLLSKEKERAPWWERLWFWARGLVRRKPRD